MVSLITVFWFHKARAGIKEVHFLPFNPTDKRTALTYIDAAGTMHRVSKGAPEQVIHNPFSLFSFQEPCNLPSITTLYEHYLTLLIYCVDSQSCT
jgi:hypothetical protein